MDFKEIFLISFIVFIGFVLFQKTELSYKVNLEGDIALNTDLVYNITNESLIEELRFNKIQVEGSVKIPNWEWIILAMI